MFSADHWKTAEAVTAALREHFSDARFAEETTYGVLLVPDPAKLDTRWAMSPDVRHDQLGRLAPDVFDERLPPGTLGISPGQDWTLVATVTGPYGISLGSYENVSGGPAEAFTVEGHETRALMIRQMWGARILQSGPTRPDCEANDHWTHRPSHRHPVSTSDGMSFSAGDSEGWGFVRVGCRVRGEWFGIGQWWGLGVVDVSGGGGPGGAAVGMVGD